MTQTTDYEENLLKRQRRDDRARRARLRAAQKYLDEHHTYADPHDAERSVLIIASHRRV